MPLPYGLIVKDLQEALTFENLPQVLSFPAPISFIVSDHGLAPVFQWAEQVEVIPRAPVRRGDLALCRTDSEIFLAWAVAPVDTDRWRVRQPLTGFESAEAIPLARVTRFLKHEGPLSLDSGWGLWLTRGLARPAPFPWFSRGLLKLFPVVWKLAHPIWPPLSLGPLEELRDTVRRAYSERFTVRLYGELDTEEVDAALSSDERNAVQRFKPGSRILDIGCGSGREALALAQLGHDVTALDVSAGMLEIARRNAEHVGAAMRFVLASLEEFDAPPNSFDGVYVSQEVYSYIPGRQRRVEALKRIRRFLADDGVLLLFQSVSSRCPWGRSFLVGVLRRISRALRRRDVSEPGDAWTAEGVHHLSFKHYFFSARELHSEVVEGGFRVEDVVGFCRICRPAFR